jgi:SAM-dependent methyltransferase
MSFDVGADAYGRFMGRFAEPLAGKFAALLDLRSGQRALDVGCGTGLLTAILVEQLGAPATAAVDPSESFVAATRAQFPDADVRRATAEALPFDDDYFDVTTAQLVVHFMTDPVAGLTEMARVTRPGGLIGASVWDHAGGTGPLSVFWKAVRDLDPTAPDESNLAGSREGQLGEFFELAGLREIRPTRLTVKVDYTDAQEWWEPYTLGVGPAGAYVAGLDSDRREDLRRRCLQVLPPAPFTISASAWVALGRP